MRSIAPMIKKSVTVFAFLFCVGAVFAQKFRTLDAPYIPHKKDTVRRHIIDDRIPLLSVKINPVRPAVEGEVRMEVEKPLCKRLSLEAGAGWIYFIYGYDETGNLADVQTVPRTYGYSLVFEPRFYLSKYNYCYGFYIMPQFIYRHYTNLAHNNTDSYTITQTTNTSGYWLQVGYKLHTQSNFTAELSCGVGNTYIKDNYAYNNPVLSSLNGPVKSALFLPVLQVSVDYTLYKKKK